MALGKTAVDREARTRTEQCPETVRIELWCNLKDYAPGYARVGFGRVYHGTLEEQQFGLIFPGGESNFTVLMTRREAEIFEPQQRYYIDFSRAMPIPDPSPDVEPKP
jgi:hypothetical protein